ncbi:MAG: TonB family protein [Spirosomataceae bacterium]
MELFIYLGKAGAGMIALYVVYWLWLRKHTYFAFNRFYLLTALLISLGAPFIVLPEKAPEPLPMAEFTIEPTTVVFQPEAAPLISTEEILLIIYGLGALFMLVRLGFRLWHIRQTIRSGERLRSGKYILVRASNENVSSFSFLNYLVLSQKDAEPYGEVVLRHELVHIRQRHSWDLLWIEFVHIFMWFNPILIFFKRSLKEIHEFIADEQATNGDRFTYARTLAGYAFGVSPQVLTNNFFDVSQLKNRIAMLTKNRSSRWVLGRYLLALPVVIGLVVLVAARSADPTALTFGQPAEELTVKGKITTPDGKGLPGVNIVVANLDRGTNTDAEGNYLINVMRGKQLVFSFVGFKTQVVEITKSEHNVIMQPEPKELNEVVVVGYGAVPSTNEVVTGQEMSKQTKEDKVFTVVEQNPEFPGGIRELGNYLARSIRYPSAAQRANVQGKVFVQFIVGEDGTIRDPKILKGIGFGCDEEALRITLNMPKWSPGKQNGKAVAVQFNLPISFVLEKQTTASNGDKSPEFPGGMAALQQYIATNLKYPEPAKRANVEGVVLTAFTVAKDGSIKDVVITKGIGFGCDAESVKLILGMPRWIPATQKGEPVEMRFNLPISFDLQDNPKIKLSQTKKDETISLFDNGKVIQEKSLGGNQYSTFSTGTAPGTEPLYILDGKEISKSDLNGKFNPEDIDNISILKDASATKIYGDKAKNGVIVITSKKATGQLKEVVVVGKPKPSDEMLNALWILDGKEMAKEQVQKLSPDNIESMNVWKGEDAVKKYGEKGKKGVIEITTKKN